MPIGSAGTGAHASVGRPLVAATPRVSPAQATLLRGSAVLLFA